MKEIDFNLYTDKSSTKVFQFTNSDDSIYNFAGSTVLFMLYLDPVTPTNISCNINVVTGKITVNFNTSHTDNAGIYEYLIEETKQDDSKVPLIKGNVIIKDYVPFSQSVDAYLATELPGDLVLTENFKIQRITFWRMFLMGAFSVPEPNINIDSSWTVTQNALVAKLVAYDVLMLAAKGSLIQALGGDYSQTVVTSTGGIKSIETGPAKVEYFPSGDTVQKILSVGSGGLSVLDTLISDICGLANFLGVKVPMCKGNKVVIGPKHYVNANWHIPTLSETINTTVASQGSINEETTI